MERQIAESDWKRWRKLAPVALERYCAKTLGKVAAFEKGSETAHERYLKLWEFLRAADRKLAGAFDNPRRSQAYVQIAAAVAQGMITRSELAEFTEETQAVIDLLLGR